MFPGNKNCTESCIKYFPFQGTDMNICGAASILSAIILTKEVFLSSIAKYKKLPSSYSWFSKLEKYNKFLRNVFIVWYVNDAIDLSLINMKKEVV